MFKRVVLFTHSTLSSFELMILIFYLKRCWELRVSTFGVICIRISAPRSVWIMVHQKNWWIHDQSGFAGSFWCSMIQTDLGSLILILITPKERTLRFAWKFGFGGRNSYSIIYSCWRLKVVILPIWSVPFRPVFSARSGRRTPTILERNLRGHLKKELKGLQVLLNLCQGLPFSNSFSSRRGRLVGLMDCTLVSGSSGPGSSPGGGHYVVFLGKALNSHSASLQPGEEMGTGELN